jgi:hypothetical protein
MDSERTVKILGRQAGRSEEKRNKMCIKVDG